MLSIIGPSIARWLDEVLLPEARNVLDEFAEYVTRWRELIEDGEQ